MMRRLPLLVLVALALFALPGCLPFAIFGADYKITVNNNTDDSIRVKAGGDIFGDAGLFDTQSHNVPRGDHDFLTINGFESSPRVTVRYHGIQRTYTVHADLLFGYETIEVNTEDFLGGNG